MEEVTLELGPGWGELGGVAVVRGHDRRATSSPGAEMHRQERMGACREGKEAGSS